MWICGAVDARVIPVEGVEVWGGDRPLWIVGGGSDGCRVVEDSTTRARLAVVGVCGAGEADLRDGLRSVARGDVRAVTRWPGSYWVVADDGARSVVVTDLVGSCPVYWARYRGSVVWSSRAAPLAELIGAVVDVRAVVARMVCPTVPEVTGTATAHVGIERLPGGHVLVAGATVRVERYEPETAAAGFSEAAEALREALVVAVGARLSGVERVSADFSGGLDSTSMALIAAGHWGRDVLAVTHDDPNSANDDLQYARRAAATQPRIRHHVVGGCSGGLFFDEMASAPSTDQPYPDVARWAMRHGYERAVLEHDTQVHLTGSGGDAILGTAPTYLADLARAGRVRPLFAHAVARARLRHMPVRSMLAAAVRLALTDYPTALRRLAADIEHPPDLWTRPSAASSLRWCYAGGITAWMTPDARRRLAADVRSAAGGDLSDMPVTVRRTWAEAREFGVYQAERLVQLHADGVPAHAPFLDNAVVRACLSVPVADRQATTRQKPLLGAALRGLVPDFILDRPTKGAYDGNGYAGVRRNVGDLQAILGASQLVLAGIIDPTRVRADLDRLLAGAPGRLATLETFVAVELWLAQHADTGPAGTWRKDNADA